MKDMRILIIDEKSMLGQSVLYMIDQRLKEIFPMNADMDFGGISIILIGDWKQLPPVGDSPLYQQNTKHPVAFQLYRKINDSIIFEKAERQNEPDQIQ